MMIKFLSGMKKENSKKQIENLVIFLGLLVIVIIVINSLFEVSDTTNEDNKSVDVVSNNLSSDDLENKLKRILSQVAGVGSVDVIVTYANTLEYVPMYDTKENTTIIEEADVNGGKRKTQETLNEQNIIYEEKNSTRVPAVKQTVMPEIIGVIVVADGASNSIIKEQIKNAVEAAVNIPSHRIQVFAK